MTDRVQSVRRACVIGWPIKHSRSPLIHGYWLKHYGLGGSYSKEAVEPQQISDFLNDLAGRGFVGCNVTVPYKEMAYAAATLRDGSAMAVGAANTLWLQDGGLACSNTDTYGFMTNLQTTAPHWSKPERPVVVLGAGGSARAVVYGFLEAGSRDIRVANRSIDRARELALHFGPSVSAHAWEDRNRLIDDASVIVNTTTLGMNGNGDPQIDFSRTRADCVIADLVYVPRNTAFLKSASQHGLQTVGGLGMLLHQAVPGFEKWFGVRPEVTPVLYDLIAQDIDGAGC